MSHVVVSSRLESLYRLAVFATFILTAWFAVPGIFWPHAVLDVLGVPVPHGLVWTAFAFQLVLLVSLYSLPVMIDWRRYLFNALVGAITHILLAIYWSWLYPKQTGLSAWGLGLCEALMGIVLLTLLGLLWKESSGWITPAVEERAL